MNNFQGKLDLLAFGAHPDDVELCCGGTLLVHIDKGKKAGIIDLTRGESGTRGTPEIRQKETEIAAGILGVSARENLCFEDGFIANDKAHIVEVIRVIRKYRPDIVLTDAFSERHPDHSKAAQLVTESCFLAGLRKIETISDGEKQTVWRPKAVYNYLQFRMKKPDIIVDISDHHDKKMEAVKAHRSQLYNPDSNEPQTIISSRDFLETITAKARVLGKQIGVKFAEGFTAGRYIGVKDLFDLI
ncbi:MAG: bacillithiol biosynthesis deacetylase BshB1 [Bacteroidota bacterium]